MGHRIPYHDLLQVETGEDREIKHGFLDRDLREDRGLGPIDADHLRVGKRHASKGRILARDVADVAMLKLAIQESTAKKTSVRELRAHKAAILKFSIFEFLIATIDLFKDFVEKFFGNI